MPPALRFAQIGGPLAEYLLGVGRLSLSLFVAAAVSAGFFIADQLGVDTRLPGWTWAAVAIVFLLVAPFLEYRRVRRQRDAAWAALANDGLVLELVSLKLSEPSPSEVLIDGVKHVALAPVNAHLRLTMLVTKPSDSPRLLRSELSMVGALQGVESPERGWQLTVAPKDARQRYVMFCALSAGLDGYFRSRLNAAEGVTLRFFDGFNDLKPHVPSGVPGRLKV